MHDLWQADIELKSRNAEEEFCQPQNKAEPNQEWKLKIKTKRSNEKTPCSIIGKSLDWETVFFDSYDYRFKQVGNQLNPAGQSFI